MDKITNLELTSHPQSKSTVDRMGLGEELIKTKAAHSWSSTVNIFNKKYPKATGFLWNERNLKLYMNGYRKRCKDVSATNTSVCDAVSRTVLNTAEGINKLNTLLNSWLDKIDATRTTLCPECSAEVEVFDTDKAVRVCAEIRRTLVTAHNLSGKLPDVEQTSETVGKAVEFTQMLDKMVQDGTIIIVSKDKPISEQVAQVLGEAPSKPKERPMRISIDDNENDSDNTA